MHFGTYFKAVGDNAFNLYEYGDLARSQGVVGYALVLLPPLLKALLAVQDQRRFAPTLLASTMLTFAGNKQAPALRPELLAQLDLESRHCQT